jgi:putative RNA 2'-phosphotransferase
MDARRLSKYLSLILRHQPERGGITLDHEGWADLHLIIQNAPGVTREAIEQVVAGNDKQRFTIEGDRIRANQGHSVPVELNLQTLPPPEVLYHGTFPGVVAAIRREGLLKMARHHVHLAEDSGTAVTVGRRSGTPVLFKVHAGRMHLAGHNFFRSVNGVWLAEYVPPEYLEEVE